jgi:pentose-5-phosphate-3-epimerase
MAVIDKRHPEIKLDQTQADIIQTKLEAAVHAHLMEDTPRQFFNSRFMQGVPWITCVNEYSQGWLMRAASELEEPREGAELIVIDCKDLPKRPRVIVRIPDVS